MASFAMMAQNMANVKSPSTKSPSAKSPSAKPPSTKSKSAKSSVKSVPRGTPPGRSRNVALAWIAGVVVLAVVAAFVAVYLTKGSPKPAAHSTAAPSDIVQAATHVPPATLAAVGLGSGTSAPRPIKGAPQLTLGGLPQVVYVGAEYCPYCAAQRWAMVVALSRFGTFSNLGVTESSTSDNPPALQTLTFYGSHYSSPYLAFTPIENQTNQPLASGAAYAPLQPVTPFERQLVQTYDASTYTGLPASQDGAIPFVDFANRYLTAGASYPATTLSGVTRANIAGSLADPSSPIAQQVDGAANLLTAALCEVTGNQPGAVCATPTITKAEAALGSTTGNGGASSTPAAGSSTPAASSSHPAGSSLPGSGG